MGNVSVLLIEAGNLFGPLSIIPLLTTLQQNTSVDWAFRSVPQKYSCTGFVNQQQLLPRGKGLGGSSQLNYMLHYSDNIGKEFDKWESFGGSGWGRATIMKHLSKYTDCSDDEATDVCAEPEVCILNVVDHVMVFLLKFINFKGCQSLSGPNFNYRLRYRVKSDISQDEGRSQ